MPTTIQLRRGTSEQWELVNPVLAAGEPGVELDTGLFKLGDGESNWVDLHYSVGGFPDPGPGPGTGGGDTLHSEDISSFYEADPVNGTVQNLTLVGDVHIYPAYTSSGVHYLTLILNQDSEGGRDITWENRVLWTAGSKPRLALYPECISIITLMTVNNGVNWFGFVSGEDMNNGDGLITE